MYLCTYRCTYKMYSSTLPKIRIASKKASKKSCSLNFAQKSPRVHISASPRSRARGLERFPSLKNKNGENWKSRFSLGPNAAKNRHRIKKASNKSCLSLNFVQKSPGAHISISPQSGARGLDRDTVNYIQFRAQRCQKYASHQKRLPIKVVRH